MAERRMFHTSVVESDAFLDLPVGAQALYFHLGMHADDDGFINGPKQIARKLRRPPKELRLLEENGFVLMFDGILVIKHWRLANSLQNDRIKPLRYPEIAEKLYITANKHYTLTGQSTENLRTIREAHLESKRNPNRTEHNRTEQNRNEHNITEHNITRCADDFAAEPQTYDDDKEMFQSHFSMDEIMDINKKMEREQYLAYLDRLEKLYYAGQAPKESHYATVIRWWNEDRRNLQ